MTNAQIQNAAYVAAMKTKKPTANGQVNVCIDKEKGLYEFRPLKDIPFKDGLTLLQFYETKIEQLEKKVETLSKKINGIDVL